MLKSMKQARGQTAMKFRYRGQGGYREGRSARRKRERALARGMQGLSVRIARALNRVLARRGTVFADRYHAHVLRSPREVANAVAYVLGNAIIHAARRGERVHPDAIDPMSSGWERQIVAQPRTWLLTRGWLRAVP